MIKFFSSADCNSVHSRSYFLASYYLYRPSRTFRSLTTDSIISSGRLFRQRVNVRRRLASITSHRLDKPLFIAHMGSNSADSMVKDLTLEDRLKRYDHSREDCLSAIKGERLPLYLGSIEVRIAIIRGIRLHDNFGTELHGLRPEFTRALNARNIMSNVIPKIERIGDFPYCIWYPEVATEATYRQLALQYPQMRYQVGRACAVAGYINLYHELNLLPDVSIAEEARDNSGRTNGSSMAIFEHIVAAPAKYNVLDDYTRSVNLDRPQPGARLNADTAVRSFIDLKRQFPYCQSLMSFWGETTMHRKYYNPFEEDYFNITEDWSIHDGDTETGAVPVPDLRYSLLYSPLPQDLPNINKDMLILHAAQSGNIDRYVRLRRPQIIAHEIELIVHGIYNNTSFAKWWSFQPEVSEDSPHYIRAPLRRAINARFIMNNDLSRITDETPDDDLPYRIYWPTYAYSRTYEDLFRRKPSMKTQIAQACIVGNYEKLYKSINVRFDQYLLAEARDSSNPYFLQDLHSKMKDDSARENGSSDDNSDESEDESEDWYKGEKVSVKQLMKTVVSPWQDDEFIPNEIVNAGLGRWISFQCYLAEVEGRVTATNAKPYNLTAGES